MHCVGFPPYINTDSELLILGSFPSVKSRENQFYYGNRRNRFWQVLAEVFSSPLPDTNEEKKELLRLNKVALWDMVTECDVVGSMDVDIKNPIVADIDSLLKNYPIKKIITNGKKADELLTKNFPHLLDITVNLPSTSPANPRFDKDKWAKELRV